MFLLKNGCMFVYGFAESIDWETHQLYLKTEIASIVQWRATPSGALESRWITKGRGTQIFYSRSFIVLFVRQNFFCVLSVGVCQPFTVWVIFKHCALVSNENSSITEIFFSLMRLGIGSQCELPDYISDNQWELLYEIAKKQTMAGIVFSAIEKLPDDKRPPKELFIRWHILCERIKSENRRMNAATHKVVENFRKEGFRSVVLKGQGVALLYPAPLYRHPGDIDIWLEGTRKEITRYVRRFVPDSNPVYHHIHFPVMKNVDIEVHFTPSWMNCYFTNRRLQNFFSKNADTEFCNEKIISDDGETATISTLAFNRVYILVHIYRHLFAEGVGMRQLLDYYMILVQGFSEDEKRELVRNLASLRLLGFARAVVYVLHKVFGLSKEYMPVEPECKQGEFLLNEILISGNFGIGDKRYGNMYSSSPFVRFVNKMKHTLRFLKYHPLEVIWAPFFRIWHYFWRKNNATEDARI